MIFKKGIVHGLCGNNEVQTQKISFFTPIVFDSPGLKTNISYRNLETFFSDLLTLSNAKLKFIIGGVKIPCQKCDMRAQPVLDVVVESRETIYELPNPEPDGNEPSVMSAATRVFESRQ